MLDNDIKEIMEVVAPNLDEARIVNTMHHLMHFGDYNIQYDFSLN